MAEIPSTETLQYSTLIKKINDHGKVQIRSLVLTNEKLYNFDGKKLKRLIELKDIEALYINTEAKTFEFVIYVPVESDYWFKSDEVT